MTGKVQHIKLRGCSAVAGGNLKRPPPVVPWRQQQIFSNTDATGSNLPVYECFILNPASKPEVEEGFSRFPKVRPVNKTDWVGREQLIRQDDC
jgi:hypothetical protein